ncbi:SDR family NAD(P)-dependent oxidoreductase [Pantoea sp. Ap-967]|uniref:SDR family NAD(P)-dependent oxidoreductase n=1 Tax=Pantoea sp. Ap-967 TaxID=2608362 RepID=UPI0014245AD5|nr:SDR family NAD(P)-dependent oxidoreductase [Pantoea sp. Ap-967]NIE77167.1 SDR family NAD(P)-dependent oxidoreductase [Pantoea sp. Ap-967]
MKKQVAVVVGVGAERGLGAALCRRFASQGFYVLVVGRTLSKIDGVIESIRRQGGDGRAYLIDVTNERDVADLFNCAVNLGSDFDSPSVVIFNAGNNSKIPFSEVTASQFEKFWRGGCFAGFLVAKQAVHCMSAGGGTLIFTGASASLRGRPNFAHFSASKAGLRMLAQSLAREYGPEGIHVAHVVIDGVIDGAKVRESGLTDMSSKNADELLDIDALAEAYLQLHQQPCSAWTHELDLRPASETF